MKKNFKHLLFVVSIFVTTNVLAQSPGPHERLSCNLAYTEAVRLYQYLGGVVGDMAPSIEAAGQRLEQEYIAEVPINKSVNLEDFNLELLSLEAIDISVFVQGNFTSPWGEMKFLTKRGPQFIAVRDRITLPMTPETATRKTDFIPNFNISKKDFINLVVYQKCRNDSPYFYTTKYIYDDGRANQPPDIYRPWPSIPFLGSLLGGGR